MPIDVKYNFIDLIRKKRDGGKFTRGEIEFLIGAFTLGEIPDYQFSAFLMAVYFQGMDFEETTNLTYAMLHSGKVLDLSSIREPKVDKHSTGGVGDKVSLILAPLVACCGVCVPMISGRSLGHTGGTLDKLESIPGFRTDLSGREFKIQLKKVGVAVMGQTKEIAPADRKIYALRDVTGTVDSIPLISASIMSKKLAEDIDGLVLDVKFGSGAFMQEYGRAKLLARTMVQIGKRAGIQVVAVLTDMNDPLGEYVGNSLEIIETIEALKGRGAHDLMEITFALAEAMLDLAGIKGGQTCLTGKIQSGEALEKFREIVEYQGGDGRVIDDYSRLPGVRKKIDVRAGSTGCVQPLNNLRLGTLALELGAGRLRTSDVIDHACGLRIRKKTGDHVKKGDVLITVYSDRAAQSARIARELQKIYVMGDRPVRKRKLIRGVITA